MPKLTNTTPGDLILNPGGVVPAGRGAEVCADVLALAMRSPAVMGWINAGQLIVHHGAKPAPQPEPQPKPDMAPEADGDIEALREAARGDGRTTTTREARARLEEMGEDW